MRGWRGTFPVLVVQAESLGAIAVIRSLGRAGYPVHACSTDPAALGLRSSFCDAPAVCPRYDSPGFLPWLRAYLHANGIRAVVPSESLLLALRPVFEEFAPLLTCGSRQEIVYAGMSKYDLLERWLDPRGPEAYRDHLPPTLLVDLTRPVPSARRFLDLGSPLYVKVDGAHARRGEPGDVVKAGSPGAVVDVLQRFARSHRRAVVQGHVGGRGVGAFFLLREGRVLAEFMHRRIHEVPHTGGASSLRESWFHQGIRDDALARLRALGWEGVAMMEYRWEEPGDRFHFLEMNGRFWGSLHLALHSGIDFPRLLLDAFAGRPQPPETDFPLGVRCRHTFPAELEHLWSKLKDPALSPAARLWPLAEFALLSADPRVHSDLLFPGDRALFLHGLGRTVRSYLARLRRLTGVGVAQETRQARIPGGEPASRALPRLAVADTP